MQSRLPTAAKAREATAEPAWTSQAPDFSPRSIRAALSIAQQGDLLQAGLVCDAMLSDGRLRGLLETRVKGLLGCPMRFEPAGDARRSARPIKDLDDESEFWEMSSEANLLRVITFGLLLNKGLGELVWERQLEGERKWVQRLVPKHPRNLHRNTDGNGWSLSVANGPDIPITPGDGRWVLFQPFGDTADPGVGLWYALALLWLSATFAEFDWSRRNEAKGRAALVGTSSSNSGIGAVGEDFAVDNPDIKAFARLIAQLRENPGIALPPGYDLKAVDFGVDDHGTFQAKGDRAYSSASILVLGQTLTTEVKGGSLAASQTHDSVRQDYRESDEAAVSTWYRAEITRPWAGVRYSDPELAPWVRWDTTPPEDIASLATTTQNASLALVQLVQLGVHVDIATYCKTFKIPVLEPGKTNDEVFTKAAPVAPVNALAKTNPADTKPAG